jgi:hypothetical protein
MILKNDNQSFEVELNRKIYALFDFTLEEINFIENDNLEELSR